MDSLDPATIVTERLTLTPLLPGDAGEMVAVLGDERLHEFIGGRPATLAELRERYARLAAGPAHPGEAWLNWVVRARPGQEAVGTVQATVSRRGDAWSALVAWVVGVPWQGRGYASEAARALVRWLCARGVAEVAAHVHPRHAASEAVAASAGLQPTADVVDGERVWRAAAG